MRPATLVIPSSLTPFADSVTVEAALDVMSRERYAYCAHTRSGQNTCSAITAKIAGPIHPILFDRIAKGTEADHGVPREICCGPASRRSGASVARSASDDDLLVAGVSLASRQTTTCSRPHVPSIRTYCPGASTLRAMLSRKYRSALGIRLLHFIEKLRGRA